MTTMANRHADQFCDLSGFDPSSARPVLFAHDGSDITLIEIKGARSIISENDFADRMIDTFAAEMAQVMKAPGHNIVVSFEFSYNAEAEVDGHLERQRHNAELKQLRVAGILDETRNVILRACSVRTAYRRLDLAPASRATARDHGAEEGQRSGPKRVAGDAGGTDPYAELPGLAAAHGLCAVVHVGPFPCRDYCQCGDTGEDGSRPDIAKIRQGIFFHETPNDSEAARTGR
ncbi:hypothetical protein V2V90_23245 (plasmid) [Agrobacterium leguminum]|uniref:hypothetical protein n=1 Tax=Agrobacterium leguminum TaxID=2792015 RepID=UPI0030CC07AF